MSRGNARRTSERAQLDQEVIVAAAIDLAAAGEPVTFRGLGNALGADPTAVYRHFRDKDELMGAVVDRLIVAIQEQLDQSASWRDQLRDGAALTIDVFAAHPHVGVESPAIATGGVGELTAINWILTQLGRAGLGPQEAVRFYAAYSSYVLAAAAAQSRQRLRDGESGATTRWVGDLRAVDAARMPAVAAVIPELVALSDREVFATGIEIFLDSVESMAAGREADSPPTTGHTSARSMKEPR
jgi:AcrR family transcriptional regulator